MKYSKLIAIAAIALAGALFCSACLADSYNISALATGVGDQVQIRSFGVPNTNVVITFTTANGIKTVKALGTTDASGHCTSTVSTADFGIIPGSKVTVTISTMLPVELSWPYVGAFPDRLSLSSYAVLLSSNRTSTIYVSGMGNLPVFVKADYDSGIVSVTQNERQLFIRPIGIGSTNVTVCSIYSTGCATVAITITRDSYDYLVFDTNRWLVPIGQTVSSTVISGGYGSYAIINNSNAEAAAATTSGRVVYISGKKIGWTALTVCTPDYLYCGIVNANVISSEITASSTPSEAVAATTSNRLIKTADNSAVYNLDSNNVRRLFANSATFWSWHNGTWQDNPVSIVSQTDFEQAKVGKNITARPGSLIKFDNSSRLYAVTGEGKICLIDSNQAAEKIYGPDFAKRLLNIQAGFEADYVRDSSCLITVGSRYPEGSLLQYVGSSDIWYIQGGFKRLVSEAGLAANNLSLNNLVQGVSISQVFVTGTAITALDASIINIK